MTTQLSARHGHQLAWYSLVMIFIALLALVCSCCCKPDSGTLTGRVVLTNDSGDPLLDPVDFAGVTIALYQPAQLDTTLIRINSEYPQVGVVTGQDTDFDHRGSDPLYLAGSEPDGTFVLEGIDPGIYNVVFLCEGWGVDYLCEVEISDRAEVDLGSMELYPVPICNPAYLDSFTFKARHCYFVQDTVNMLGNVVLEANSKILMLPGASIKFWGGVSTPQTGGISSACRFISGKNFYQTQAYDITPADHYSAVEFRSDNNVLRNVIFQHGSSSVVVSGLQNQISNVIIRNIGAGLIIQGGHSVVDHILVANGSANGIQFNTVTPDQIEITNSVITKVEVAASLYTAGTYTIENSYFHNNNFAVKPDNCTGVISHNAFELNAYDIYQYAVSIPTQINYNDFFHSTQWGILPRRAVVINYNNFFKTDRFYIWIRSPDSPPNYSLVQADVDATNNYWAVADVEQYLMDGHNHDFPDQPCAYYVIYLPRRNSPVPNAGIQ
ncbi:MAG TPA: right-handed parallel beta-helix repeat-containing protein [Candidatus Syntrophosphaera sp.]|nr:right-handed parallel beta-helix repeat-containing protein [Candidatus Syntrophosphaera sp.]